MLLKARGLEPHLFSKNKAELPFIIPIKKEEAL
jgi:hypothetical protein